MTTAIRLALVALVLVLLLALGAWYYLFGPNKVASADLLPSNTIVFASIPNAARIATDYQTSQLKKLVDAPESKPLHDELTQLVGAKNLDLLQSLLPELSGQSFLALTRFDVDNFAHVGLIGGLKPKPGTGSLNDLVAKLKAAYPELLAQGTTGAGNIEGLDYQWIKGPGASDKICVVENGGWIITAWGEDTLRDWWERSQKKSSTPSLAQNPDYRKSIKRVGLDSEALVYVDYHALVGLLQKQLARGNPAQANYFGSKMAGFGPMTIGTQFEHGEIVDRFSFLVPKDAQLTAGMSTAACAYDTLKFTGPDTRFYWGSSVNFTHLWQSLQDQAGLASASSSWAPSLQSWAQSKNLDVQRNLIAPLGNEISVQAEWSSESSYPEAGLFVKLDKPDDFKPTIAAFIDTIRQAYATTAVVNEINSDGQNFATLKFVQSLPISPTITEDGPYLGIFLTENQAVRSFKRDASVGLLNNADFKRQLGDRMTSSRQIAFMDTPQLLDRGYQAALPYVSLAAMFNRTLGSMVQGRTLPADLQWLAPMGAWAFVTSSDDEGVTGYSVSGIGNQGILLGGTMAGGFEAMQFFRPPAPPPFVPAPISPSNSPVATPIPAVTNAPPEPSPVTLAPDATNSPAPISPGDPLNATNSATPSSTNH